ncbi:UDP-glucose--hexose-1-phosphate uridylyltransferase [Clostridium sp. Ade.TY]|uniref:UDP-glucose--hexose-1-phosphate uridylyltransferase n=1 Tax=Clostridium sp. Ade.TY TaxID=1391647 RepID=UPI000427252A|nr:UDP-glucose--hexose-1-phosphate uridylyltransferase [Clostridium sp. Ade.TY]
MGIYRDIDRLIKYSVMKNLIECEDEVYIRNSLLELFKLDDYEASDIEDEVLNTPTPILESLLDYAYEKGLIEYNTPIYRDLFDTKIMGILVKRPSEIIRDFNYKYKKNPEEATTYFHNISKACDYIRTDRIAKNLVWKTNSEYGNIDITINLSKPEKDPKAIEAAKSLQQSGYPKCLLCKENEGYAGRVNHPARQNLRVIPIELLDERWFLQYSPYAYYNEHCIVFSGKHIPMKITKDSFDRILEFVEKFPHYFIGSNADLPIVGGSILTHDHYQGGNYKFAMNDAKDVFKFNIDNYKDIELSIIKWPLTVIRLRGKDREKLSELSGKILEHWRNYSDEDAGVFAYTKDVPHNTITPIGRFFNEKYELDLVLRNNRKNNEHPDGIFHPHKELHHIKKENIGLIEVLGLAVLPARLKEELKVIEKNLILNDENSINKEEIGIHLDWFYEIIRNNKDINENNVEKIVKDEVGKVFVKVLEHCGVFKWNESGIKSIKKYIDSLKSSI